MSTPRVSCVMGVRNAAASLGATMDSVLQQTGCDFEVIVVDDGSTDGTAALLDAWAARDGRVRAVRQAGAGLTRALVRGCGEARGAFIARQDAGDLSLPGRFAAQAALLESQPALAFAGCGYALVGPAGEPLAEPGAAAPAAAAPGEGLRNHDGRVQPNPHHGTVMFRTSAYLQAGGYRPGFYFAQDVDLWSRLIEIGDFGHVPQVLYQVKFELDSITARHRASQQRLRELVRAAAAQRALGASDAAVLAEAARIRPADIAASPPDPAHRTAAAYFVGSCLAARGDARARGYLRQVVRRQPWHFKAWVKLAALAARGNR
jgi:glycosyltransferase involved in cell wall biosynthesis